MQNQNRVYFDYLDSLRFCAFLVVFVAHAGILFPVTSDWFYALYRNIISHGSYGVNFFFILSGFLITYLLLQEKKKTGDVDIKIFYLKRVLRIWPVYYIVFFVSLFVLPSVIQALGAGYVPGSIESFPNLNMEAGEGVSWWFLLFSGNFYRALDLGLTPFTLGVLWSVCVEEQFYLFWPWVVKKLSGKGIFYASLILFAISLIYKAVHINDANIAYYSTVSVAMDLAVGCALGVLYFRFEPFVRRFVDIALRVIRRPFAGGWHGFVYRVRKTRTRLRQLGTDMRSRIGDTQMASLYIVCGFILLIFLANVWYTLSQGDRLFYDFARLMKRPVLNGLFAAILIYFLVKEVPAQKSKLFERFSYLGKISYGLYAYHAIFMIFILAIFNHYGMGPNDISVAKFLAMFLLSFGLTVIASHFSFVYMEKAFLAVKDRMVSRAKLVQGGEKK